MAVLQMNQLKKNVIVLGSGISGLSAAWRLSDNGIEVDIFESSLSVGGLAGTLREGRYFMDIGPHSFFSEDEQIVNTVHRLFENKLQPRMRKVKLYYKGKYINYPLTTQGVFFQMGFSSGILAVSSFLKSRLTPYKNILVSKTGETVQDWAITNFGEYLYQTFFKPYTEQFWKIPCSELSSSAIPKHTRMNFMNTLKLLLCKKFSKQKESLIGRDTLPTYYPDNGFAEIAEKIAGLIKKNHGRIHLGCEVTDITELPNGKMRIFYHCNGEQKKMDGDYIISTIPLPLLVEMLNPSAPSEVIASANKLEYRSLVVLGMLLERQKILNCECLYLLNRPFNRIFEMSEFSSHASLSGESIIAVEIPCLRDSAIWAATKEELFDMCSASIYEDGFINNGDDVKKLFLVKAPYAYPIYRKDYAAHLKRITDYLKKYKSLATLGRCGEFMYMDIDECMKRAFNFVNSYFLTFGNSPKHL